MPIWVIGRTSVVLSTEGLVLEGVDMGDVQSSHRLENVGVAIHMVWLELSELVGIEGVTVQQQGERHKDLRLD